MANIIKLNSNTSGTDCLYMNNGLMDVFIDVLSLSGSRLAQTIDEKRLIVWLSEKDQSRAGAGTVGFDLCEMPWNIQTFQENKAFLQRVIAAAKNRAGWEKLDYLPKEELLFPKLDQFAELMLQMNIHDVQPAELEKWLADATTHDPVVVGFPMCPEHYTLLTVFGCHICNN